MKKLSILFVVFSFIMISSSVCFSQQWSDEQNEVWKTVETYNALMDKKDAQELLSYFDDSYSGWSYRVDAPIDKSAVKTMMGYWLPNSKTLYYTLTPAKIWVNGNFAFVHYYYTQYVEDDKGEKQWEKGRWTDILMKKDGKWVIVGDHGGRTSK